jgi:hypothetical protein
MALSHEDRERIREEELLRLQIAEEFERSHRKNWWTEPRMIGSGVFVATIVALAFLVMRTV